MVAIHRALIEALVYIATVEGADDQEDDDVRVLESIFAELAQATPAEVEQFLAVVKAKLEATQNPARIGALQGIIDSLSE